MKNELCVENFHAKRRNRGKRVVFLGLKSHGSGCALIHMIHKSIQNIESTEFKSFKGSKHQITLLPNFKLRN
jgi:hypothetical protein